MGSQRRGPRGRRNPRGSKGSDSFSGFIAPATLIDQVRSAAPWILAAPSPALPEPAPPLARLAERPDGYLALLHQPLPAPPDSAPDDDAWCAYFALCLAAHFASVATYVPTDVDTKIRDHLWFTIGDDALPAACALALATGRWDVRPVTARGVDVSDVPGQGFLSGHDGERLSVLCGGLLRCLVAGRDDLAAELHDAVDAELRRESAALLAVARERPRDLDLLRLAAILTHNAGDVDQGLGARGGVDVGARARTAFARLAHEGGERYGGGFRLANALYQVIAADGHRHYPLREVRVLRSDRRLLLPIAPFLEGWGETVATLSALSVRQRAEVAEGLVLGCERVRGQEGYYRALHGLHRATRGGLRALGPEMARNLWRRAERDRELWARIEVTEPAFAALLADPAARVLSEHGTVAGRSGA